MPMSSFDPHRRAGFDIKGGGVSNEGESRSGPSGYMDDPVRMIGLV